MSKTPSDWVLIEAAKRSGDAVLVADYIRYNTYEHSRIFRALCDMIERYEQPPVDRKLLCAREAVRVVMFPEKVETTCVRAIELWESGYGS